MKDILVHRFSNPGKNPFSIVDLGMPLIHAVLKDDKFLAEVRSKLPDTDAIHLWWLGQSGYLLQFRGATLLIDPYLSDSLTKKYDGTARPHIRICERVIDPARLDFIDLVTSSHNHTDHLDGETIIPLLKSNPGLRMIIPEANRAFISARIGMPEDFPIGLNDGQVITLCGFSFHGIPAAHNELERDEKQNCRYMGYVIEAGGKKIYHSGDTLLYPGMEDILKPFQIDLALLPINGNDLSRGVAGNLDAAEAIQLARAIGAKTTIPCHYDMFRFNTADVRVFIREAERQQIGFRVLSVGGYYRLVV